MNELRKQSQFKTLAQGTNNTSLILSDNEIKVVKDGEVIGVLGEVTA